MSTLKVDNIQSYSGGDVTTQGNQTTNGTLTVNGQEDINGNVTVTNGGILQTRPDNADVELIQNEAYKTEFYGNRLLWKQGNEAALQMGELNKVSLTMNSFTSDFSTDHLINIQSTLTDGTKFDDWAGTWMTVPEAGTPSIKRGLDVQGGGISVTGSAVQANSGLNVNGQTNLANTTTNGLLNATAGIRISGSNIVQHSGFPGQQAHIFQNENFFTEFYGTDLRWNQTGGTSGLVMGELNSVQLTLNSFTPDFSTDHLFEVKNTLASGTTIGDWAGLWMTVPEAGTPVMKRGLTIEGLGDYADDAAAATGGVPVNGVYRTGSVLKIRVV